MSRSLQHVFWLGWKELLTLGRTPALVLFIGYALTVLVYATGEGISVSTLSVEISSRARAG